MHLLRDPAARAAALCFVLLGLLLHPTPAAAQPSSLPTEPAMPDTTWVLEADKTDALRDLIADVGFYTELPGGYRFDSMQVDKDRVTFTLSTVPGDQPVGRLLLVPKTEAAPEDLLSRDFAVRVETESPEPAVAELLSRAAGSVVKRDEGGFLSRAMVPPEGLRRPDGGGVGRVLGDMVSSENAVTPGGLSVQVRIAILLLVLLGSAFLIIVPFRPREYEVGTRLVQTHLIPVGIQLTVFGYWSLYWTPVRPHMLEILMQVVFAFICDGLLGLISRRRWTLSFAPVPVVLSANLFVWFAGTDTYLGFLVVAVALASKHFIHRDGRHVFNPSGFGVAFVGLLCLLLPEWFGYVDIARQLDLPPNMFELVVILVLIAQSRVPIVLVTLSGFVALYLLPSITGFIHMSPLYPAVTIILLLFITDPATIPRSGLGKVLYGLTAGLLIHLSAEYLDRMVGMDFWAKVLPVPVVNYLAPWFDRAARAVPETLRRWAEPRWNRVHIAVWLILAITTISLPGAKHYDTVAHFEYETNKVVTRADGSSSCEENPVFCTPFSFIGELRLWLGERPEDGGTEGE